MPAVVVTGATGFLGRRISAVLTESGVEVVGVARHRVSGPWSSFALIDVGDPDAVWPVRAGDLVVHAAGMAHDLSGRNIGDYEYWHTNSDGARNAAKAVRDRGGRGLILLSSVKAMAESTTVGGVDESSRCHPRTNYGRSKLAGEELAAAELMDSACVLTILRLTPVYGEEGRGNLERLVRLSRKRAMPWLPTRTGHRSMVHVDDVARLVEVLVHGPVPGTFIVEEGQAYTPRRIQEMVRGRQPRGWHMTVPAAAIRAAGVAGSISAAVTGRSPFTRRDADRLLEHAVYNGSELRTRVQWSPVHSLGRVLGDADPGAK